MAVRGTVLAGPFAPFIWREDGERMIDETQGVAAAVARLAADQGLTLEIQMPEMGMNELREIAQRWERAEVRYAGALPVDRVTIVGGWIKPTTGNIAALNKGESLSDEGELVGTEGGALLQAKAGFAGVLWPADDGSITLHGPSGRIGVYPPGDPHPLAVELSARNRRKRLVSPFLPDDEPDEPPGSGALERSFGTTADPLGFSATPETYEAVALLCDYHERKNISIDPLSMRAVHQRPKALARSYLDLADKLRYDPLAPPADTEALLWAEVGRLDGSRNEALVSLYVLSKILDSKTGAADVGFAELMDLEGSKDATKAERVARSVSYDGAFKISSAWKINVRRPWKGGGKVTMIEHDAPLFHYEGPAYKEGQKPLPGMPLVAPHGYVFRASTLTEHLRNNPAQACVFGPLLSIARIPRGKAWGDWAVSIGLSVSVFLGRVNAHEVGDRIRHTRRKLLLMFPPDHGPEELLNGKNPGRAREYWSDAIKTLVEQGIVAHIEEPNPTSRKGWKDDWLDEVVTITLAGEWARIANELRDGKASTIEATKPKVGRKSAGRPDKNL